MKTKAKPKAAKPLQGRRVLVTRAGRQAPGLSGPLRALGAKVIAISD